MNFVFIIKAIVIFCIFIIVSKIFLKIQDLNEHIKLQREKFRNKSRYIVDRRILVCLLISILIFGCFFVLYLAGFFK